MEWKKYNLRLFDFNLVEFWRNPPIEVVVSYYGVGSIIYTFTIGNNANATKFWGQREKIGTETNGRTITNITMDDNTKDIIITFGGDLTKNSHILLKLV